jgi:hypothetical protein
MTPEDFNGSSLHEVAQIVAGAEPIALADRLPQWTDEEQRNQVAAEVCIPLAGKDLARAHAIASAITDEALRDKVINQLNKQ